MGIRCPYCNKTIAADLVGAVTILCRGCKRTLRIECDNSGTPRFTAMAETTHHRSAARTFVATVE